MARTIVSLAPAYCAMLPSGAIRAGPPPKLAKELIEKVFAKFRQEVTDKGTEVVAKKVAPWSEHFGAEAWKLFERTRPKGVRVLEAAGLNADRLAPLLAQHGKEAAWLVANPGRALLVLRHGDAAAQSLLRHRHVGEVLIREWGQPAAQALAALNPQNGRRLAMILDAGQPLGRADPKGLLGVLTEHGNPAMDFVWRNKGALAISACLAAFVNDPKPFLAGGRDLAQVLGHTALQPVTEAASEASRQMTWPVMLIVGLGTMGVWLHLWRRRKHQASAAHGL